MTGPLDLLLVVDDDPAIRFAAELLLGELFTEVAGIAEPAEAMRVAQKRSPDIVLLDMNFSRGATNGREGFSALRALLEADPDCVIIVITAHADLEIAVEALKLGASDFLQKPWDNERLQATVRAGAALRTARRSIADQKQKAEALARYSGPSEALLLGTSRVMVDLISQIERVAPTDANVLILGENGTGKELVARDIHRRSLRRDGPMISIDLGALGETVIESELFGHRKGAFTDARADRIGRIQAADGGTLFLDEIGNLPLHLQPKLLTVLEQRAVTPLGSNKPVPVDVRVIAATNWTHERLSDDRAFRRDLLFRLETVAISIPPLRERPDDIPLLLEHYLGHYQSKYQKSPRQVSDAILEMLHSHSWPGNVRELRHLVERAVIMATGDRFHENDFPIRSAHQEKRVDNSGRAGGLNLADNERELVSEALRRNGYNISHAARDLGITRHSLYRRMEKHGL